MKMKFFKMISAVLVSLLILGAFSCKKKDVRTLSVDTQLALALFSDTISLREIINDMDTTTQSWLRVRNDSIFAYYADTVMGVIKASDFLNDIPNVSFNTQTEFDFPDISFGSAIDTTIAVERFATVPFSYEGYSITEVILRSGVMSFSLNLNPDIPALEKIEVYSEHILSPEGEPLRILLEGTGGSGSVDLAEYRIIPENDTVAMSSKITIHYTPDMVLGNHYSCDLSGSLNGLMFKTVYGTVEKPFDSIFDDQTAIDYGISGLSGSATLPIPTIKLTYRNTFGFGATGDVTKLEFVNENNGFVTNLLAYDLVEVNVRPTEGEWKSMRIEGFTEEVDALAGFTRLDFGGEVMMDLSDGGFSVSDTSAVDVVADIEMPFKFKITDLHYTDTIDVDFTGGDMDDIDDIDDLFDEIDFFIDYNSKIKLNVSMQAEFLRNTIKLEDMFDEVQYLNYDPTTAISTIKCVVTGDRLKNVMRANKMVLKLGVETPGTGTVTMMDSDDIFIRFKMLTKSSEIDFDDVL